MSTEKAVENEIDLVEVAKLIWQKRKFILKITAIFFLTGLIIAFTSKVEYAATCKLLPESQNSEALNLGGISRLAGLAGFDLSGFKDRAGSLRPELYPEIVKSTPFVDKLIHTPVLFERQDTIISSFYYFSELDRPSLLSWITVGLPGKLKKLLSNKENIKELDNKNFVRYTKEEWEILENYTDRLSVEVDKKSQIIEIVAEMPDAVAAAEIAGLVVQGLTTQVTNHKTEKTKIYLDFIEERFLEAKKDYERIQKRVARYSDRNRNLADALAQAEHQRLKYELDIAFEVYKQLTTQLEQVKIKIKEETPVFTVLEPVRIPEKKDKPKRMIILLVSIFLGLSFCITFVFLRSYFAT